MPRPCRARHDYDVGYLGYGIDGHYGWLNATAMTYGLLGRERQGTFTDRPERLQAWFAAAELSVDSDYRRWRLSLLHASATPTRVISVRPDSTV